MKKLVAMLFLFASFVCMLFKLSSGEEEGAMMGKIKLPTVRYQGHMTVEEALMKRRSVRDFQDEALKLDDMAQLLWAAQGVSCPTGYRTAPSAGALYPLETYVAVGKVATLRSGIYRYDPRAHQLTMTADGDKRLEICSAALDQSAIRKAPVSFILAAVYERTTAKYRDRGIRYVHMEVGHAAQNLCLQAVALGLDTVVIGAFYDDDVKRIMQLPVNEQPLYIIPVGKRSS